MTRKIGILTALVGSLLVLGSMSARTPDGTKIRAGGEADSTVKAGNGGLHSSRENTEPERLSGEQQQQQQSPSPPSFYRALSRRSVGRYILATSSLVGECARVYTPAPLGLVASSLWNRFSMGLDSHGRDRRGSLGPKKSSGFSYDRFMSPNDRTGDDEDLPGDGDAAAAVPPDKYGRVSSAFLARHDIGDLPRTTEGPERAENEFDDEKTEPVAPPPGVDERSRDQNIRNVIRTTRRQSTRQSAHTAAGSVFKSIASLGRDRTKRAMDDMDLLSDSEDEGDGCDGGGGGEGRLGDVLSARTFVSDTTATPAAAHSGRVSAESTVGRNLVNADDTATTLVNKLRLGKKTEGGESSHLRSRRKTRRSQRLE